MPMNKITTVEAFVLVNREQLRPEPKPSEHIYFDGKLQLWVDSKTGKPVVLRNVGKAPDRLCSDFGETTMTKTQEGADQTEIIRCSDFGETAITETREGADQTEMVAGSDFGETTLTRSQEGTDQAEAVGFSEFGETSFTATREGVDASEMIA